MKISAAARAVPDDAVHGLYEHLFGGEDSFELSTIRPEDASIAIEMLIGNYSAPMDAVIRELVVNAIDSHRAVGQQTPVELVMPTEDEPYLVVRDQGLGLSPTDMVSVYTRPAASTKRNENLSTGGLGIGAKAPFTVVDRFLVRGVKDGVSATLAMARIDGKLKHRVDEIMPVDSATPNGVTVIVPVDPTTTEAWWKALSRVHFWWDEGLVEIANRDASPVNLPTWQERLLDGETPGPVPEVLAPRELKTPTVLMGQIGYQIPDDVAPTKLPALYRVAVGALTIAPTRESIVDTEENRELLRRLLKTWQDETLAPIGEKLKDPTTSIMSLWEIQTSLIERGLMHHMNQWIVDRDAAERELLPKHGLHHMTRNLLPGSMTRPRLDVRPHGIPGETNARPRSLGELFDNAGFSGSSFPPIVFCDEETLPNGKRKILTKWARQENLVVVVVNREALEQRRFAAVWGYQENGELTRPFADPGQLEWLDPADVQITRAPRTPVEKIGENSPVTAYQLMSRRSRLDLTVRELVDQVTSTPNSYVIIDTVAELKALPYPLPESVLVLQSGQRAAKLVRELAGKRAVTVEQFTKQQTGIVLKSLTPAQRRWVADAELARNQGVKQYFQDHTRWIDEIEDPAVQTVARKISTLVTRANAYLDPRSELSKRDARLRQGVEYRSALSTVLRDQRWVIAHGALGEYLPALMASQSRGLGRSWDFYEALVKEHIVATIAAQLVARANEREDHARS